MTADRPVVNDKPAKGGRNAKGGTGEPAESRKARTGVSPDRGFRRRPRGPIPDESFPILTLFYG